MPNNRKELLKKLKALAEQGIGGEKINAQAKLAALMKKYNITDSELNDECVQRYDFKCKTDIEETLLKQTIYKVTNSESMYDYIKSTTGKRIKHLIGCDCTKAQKLEIEFLFDFYKRIFKKDLETLISAFIQKHRIFGELQEGEEPMQIDEEEYQRLFLMQQSLTDEQPQKQIEMHKGGRME